MAYSDKVQDYFENPRNAGSLDPNDPLVGTALVGTPASGEVIRLQIKVDPQTGRIAQARFKTYGSGPTIAAASLTTEWVHGKTLDAATAITNGDIARELSLPPLKIHCSILAEQAIKAAVSDYRNKHGAPATAG
ncbi:MAG: iron-sulfur cluster assembly scaffold protein [Comamonadaceae bacterium]|nr:iron-sulfur cluster assembly scaffold protein [Burkholderiales bacterium]MEB2349442.1 iron-sulfur cluster assembly scaffold protein [Comamonadaceae bacterium]